jgi:hypothetical protein
MAAGPDWTIAADDGAQWHGLESIEGLFTVLHITYTDVETSEKRVVTKHHADIGKFGGFARLVRAGAPMKTADVEAIAERVMAVLGGDTPGRYFAMLGDDRPLLHRSGNRRLPTEIAKSDVVDLENAPGPLEVYSVTHDRSAGTVLLQLTSGPVDERADVELLLMNVERGEV